MKKKRKSCRGKIGHNSRTAACIARRKTGTGQLKFVVRGVYKCRFCGKWHVGKTSKVDYSAFDHLT